ncbi:hypothetical protein [Micromonospora halophytica]|uniref:Uncharacterized protein n=1 Tax=Micromonospora halophytica TaxID=47864 RepID=A0A1C5ISR6_9ACTN|nr:hypothetical protein [Micromonospora halophytica]SCG61364.1 hypothetical protein GA0070560_11630 [Micromonospora halophytica]
MVAAHVHIAPLTPTCALDESGLRDLIYAQATPAAAVEHIRIRAGPHGADILAFIDSDDPKEAADTLHHLVEKVIANTPLLRPWRII